MRKHTWLLLIVVTGLAGYRLGSCRASRAPQAARPCVPVQATAALPARAASRPTRATSRPTVQLSAPTSRAAKR